MKLIRATKYLFLYAVLSSAAIWAQTFPSGSTGADGALTLTTPGVVNFDPKSFPKPLNPSGDGIYNFTSITIGAGVTVKLKGDVINTPVVWLSSTPVKIDGTLDLSGQDGFNSANTTQRVNTIPGAGGYGGGYPGIGPNPAGAGLGPAGGIVGTGNGCNAYSRAGGFTGNQFLVPLTGGSGGGGNSTQAGGAGGGAILIASDVSISGAGGINASGGSYPNSASGSGAGGGIRLVAPVVALTGVLNVKGGGYTPCSGGYASDGIVRVEGFQIGPLTVQGPLYTATPFNLFLSQAGASTVSVVKVGGNAVPPSPTGSFTMPDVTVNSSGPLVVDIQAANVPLGTVVTLQVFSENGPDQTIQSTGLAGTLASSTATATIPSLPPGFSKGFVKATF